jgi:CRP-like cAMP-binding protein
MNMGMMSLQVDRQAPPVYPMTGSFNALPMQRDLIASYTPLAHLSEADQTALMQWSKVRTLKRREVLVRQGDPGGTVMLVVEGYLKVSRTLADGREVVLDIVGPGTCFGEMTVMNKSLHDITALSRVSLLFIDGRKFKQVLEPRPEALLAIMRSVGERLQRATDQVVDARGHSAPVRLAKTLLQMARLQLQSLHKGDAVRLRLSQSDLGAMTGLTRESVNKILANWRDAGWILQSRGTVTLIDSAALTGIMRNESEMAC